MSRDRAAQLADLHALTGTEGLYVGQLDHVQLHAFDRLVHDGLATRAYAGAAGLLGLAKVKFIRQPVVRAHGPECLCNLCRRIGPVREYE